MPDDIRSEVPTVLNDQKQRVPCPDYYAEQGGTCQRLDNFYCDGCPDRNKRSPTARTVRPLTEGYIHKGGHNAFPSQVTERPAPPSPVRLADLDFAQIEARAVFMAGFQQGCAMSGGGFDQSDANKSFETFVKNYGAQQ